MSLNSFDHLKGKALMDVYKFVKIGNITAPNSLTFSIDIELDECQLWEKSVYIFIFNDEIVRIGSSKGLLKRRMRRWSCDVTNALNTKNSSTPTNEALAWQALLSEYGSGDVYARKASTVNTPIGTFETYMDEESVLINRHKPKMNRHTNR